MPVVDERGGACARVRLLDENNTTWQTWDAPFGDLEDWVTQAEALVSELSEEFTGPCALVFQCETDSGQIRAQLPRTVQGKARRAAKTGSYFGQQANAMAPLQQQYESQAKLVDKLMASANVQIEVLTRTVEQQGQRHSELLEYVRVAAETLALQKQEERSSRTEELMGQALEQLPAVLELLKSAKIKKPAAAAATATASAAANGAAKALQTAAAETAGQAITKALTPSN